MPVDEPEPLVWSPREWVSQALCSGMDAELFYPERGEGAGAARAVCLRCEVMVECREWALDTNEKFGIWGGTSPRQRQRIRRERRREERLGGVSPPSAMLPSADEGRCA